MSLLKLWWWTITIVLLLYYEIFLFVLWHYLRKEASLELVYLLVKNVSKTKTNDFCLIVGCFFFLNRKISWLWSYKEYMCMHRGVCAYRHVFVSMFSLVFKVDDLPAVWWLLLWHITDQNTVNKWHITCLLEATILMAVKMCYFETLAPC